jgi:hypothetical protein
VAVHSLLGREYSLYCSHARFRTQSTTVDSLGLFRRMIYQIELMSSAVYTQHCTPGETSTDPPSSKILVLSPRATKVRFLALNCKLTPPCFVASNCIFSLSTHSSTVVLANLALRGNFVAALLARRDRHLFSLSLLYSPKSLPAVLISSRYILSDAVKNAL